MPDGARGSEKPTILLVDDDKPIRELLAGALSRKYRVLQAGDGMRALDVFSDQSDSIELVVTDIRMPVLDGIGLAERLTAQKPSLKMLFISGFFEEDERTRRLVDVGAAFMSKPFALRALVAKVDELLGRAARRAKAQADPTQHD